MMTGPSTSRLDPGANDLLACTFTGICRRSTPEYNANYATDRALREICTTPIFKHPKVLMIPIKNEKQLDDGRIGQAWFPWQVCTNCIAGRAKCRCSLWYAAMQITTPIQVYKLQPGQVSDWDSSYGWFTGLRDYFSMKDLGYYELWECHDGMKRTIVRLLPFSSYIL